MGKRLNKSVLLAEIAGERSKLLQLLNTIPDRRMTKRGINSMDWSIKDVLAHLYDWEARTNSWFEAGINGEAPEVPGDGFKWNQTRQLNAFIYRKHRGRSLAAVTADFELVHDQTLNNLGQATGRQLTTLSFFQWTGNSWTVSDYFRANTASHYKWARLKIVKWLRSSNC